MDRFEAAEKVQDHKEFFRHKWAEFCESVEDFAGQLAGYQDEREPREGWVKWAIYDMELSAHHARHLRLRPWVIFFAPPELVNPVNWALGRKGDNPRAPNETERILVACARLVVAYDETVDEPHRIHHGGYGGPYFDCNGFCRELAGELARMEDAGDLAVAWACVKKHLPNELTPATDAAGPHTETPLADRIEDLAHDVGKIAWFESRNVHTIAETVAARDSEEAFADSVLARLAKRQMHGKPEAEQRQIEKWYRDLWERPPLDADGYLDGVCDEFFSHWTPAVERAQALARDITAQIQTARAPWEGLLRDALAAVLPVARDGQTFLDACRETLAIDAFTPNETREELFGHADLFAERLGKSDTEARLRQMADTLWAHAVPTPENSGTKSNETADRDPRWPAELVRLYQLEKWAKEIGKLAAKPVIRRQLQELIRPLAEQDKAHKAQREVNPLDDPCDILTYRLPGTLVTRLHAPYDTTLPALGSEEAERERQAIMLVGVHDRCRQVKISAGIWPPELLERVWTRMQSDPPNGPMESVIEEALEWLRGLVSEAADKGIKSGNAGGRSETTGEPDVAEPSIDAVYTHTDDFSTVCWCGREYHFNRTQAKCIAKLWAEWEKNPSGRMALHQFTIRDAIESESETFRLALVFRNEGKPHPAWGQMIHSLGDGRFYLGKPQPQPKKTAKKAQKKRRITK